MQAEQLGKLMPRNVEGPTELWQLLGGRPSWNTQPLRTVLQSPGTGLTLVMAYGGMLVSPIVASDLPGNHTFQGEGYSFL